MPTPEQIRQAAINTLQRPRTTGARILDALQHVQQSKEKPARKLVSHNVLWRGHHNEERSYGCHQV